METIKKLIAALREELQQYGEMLARMDEQQECVLRRAADELLQTVDAVQTQGVVLAEQRRIREQHQQETALDLGLPASSALLEIIPRLPDVYRPLVQALMQENNDLLVRVQQRARQNHLLLTRSLELMQDLLGSLVPVNNGAAYNQNGGAFGRPIAPRAIYEAVG